jgi:hypothetical protein
LLVHHDFGRYQEGRSDEARRYFEDALAIRRRLSEAEPERADLARDLAVSGDVPPETRALTPVPGPAHDTMSYAD